jgi:hypothetical protein
MWDLGFRILSGQPGGGSTPPSPTSVDQRIRGLAGDGAILGLGREGLRANLLITASVQISTEVAPQSGPKDESSSAFGRLLIQSRGDVAIEVQGDRDR